MTMSILQNRKLEGREIGNWKAALCSIELSSQALTKHFGPEARFLSPPHAALKPALALLLV